MIKDSFKDGFLCASFEKYRNERTLRFTVKSEDDNDIIWIAIKEIENIWASDSFIKKEMTEIFNDYIKQLKEPATKKNFKEFFSGKGFNVLDDIYYPY